MSHPKTDLGQRLRGKCRGHRSLFLAGCVALAAAGCNRGAPAGPPPRGPAPVTVATAATKDVPFYLDEIGKCAAVELVNVSPQVSGRIDQVHFADGADVKKGDLLFTIDPRWFQAELAKAEANLAQSRAALDLAKIDLERMTRLRPSNAVSEQEFDASRNTVAVDEAQVAAGQAATASAKLNLEYASVRSPLDGRAGIRAVDAGNIVKANETQLVVLQRLDPMYVDFTTTERNLPTVRQSMKGGELAVQVRVPGAGGAGQGGREGHGHEGKLTFVDAAVQPGTGTVKLRATLSNADRQLSAGQFVDVRLILATKKDAVLVPAQAVQVGQEGPFVYVVSADSKADQRKIKPGQQQGEMVVIEDGVKAGDKVVVTGQMAIAPGAAVQILLDAKGPATAPQQARAGEGTGQS